MFKLYIFFKSKCGRRFREKPIAAKRAPIFQPSRVIAYCDDYFGIVIILDNATIHKSKKVKSYLNRHTKIHLFYLPAYSPEYNPVELFWKWIEPKVCGFSALGGIDELIKRFRKYVWHFNNRRLVKPNKFTFKTYQELL